MTSARAAAANTSIATTATAPSAATCFKTRLAPRSAEPWFFMPSQSSHANPAALAPYSMAQAAFGRFHAKGIQPGMTTFIVMWAASMTPPIAGATRASARTPLVLSEETYRLTVAAAAIAAAGGQASRTGPGPDANSA